jgi:pyruvate,water dikinase
MAAPRFVRWFRDVGIDDIPLVDGKNASLGQMIRELVPQGIRVPEGFAITAEGYRHFLKGRSLDSALRAILSGLDTRDLPGLAERSRRARVLRSWEFGGRT